MNYKQITIILFSSLVIASCGGGGGGGSSSAASPVASAAPTYSYDRIDSDYTNQAWDAGTQMRRSASSGAPLAFGGYGDYPLTIAITEGSSYFDISITGDLNASSSTDASLNLDFRLDSTTLVEPLINSDGVEISALFQQTFRNANLYGFVFLPEGLNSVTNIKYTNVGFLDFYFNDGERDTFAFNYGSKTDSGDMPTSGTAVYNLETFMMLQAFRANDSNLNIVSEGDGNLNANFSTGSIDGSLTFRKYYEYLDFLNSGANSTTQLLDVDTLAVTFSGGSLNTNNFSGNASIDDGDGFVGSGVFQGSFFGNNANETSGTFLVSKDLDSDTSGTDYWDMEGVFLGCKNSGC